MADLIQWRVDPMCARGFGPHQVVVYIASAYIGNRCIDSVACANRREARTIAMQMVRDCRSVSVASDSSSSSGCSQKGEG